jgi:ubiquitin carboxyl-terminal hydrolase 7
VELAEAAESQDTIFCVAAAAGHIFHSQAVDWGFTQFHPLQDLRDPQNGYLLNDTLILRVEVKVERPEATVQHDSKKETGYVGLKNQGATCYMNSLLQTLYNLNYFRQVTD